MTIPAVSKEQYIPTSEQPVSNSLGEPSVIRNIPMAKMDPVKEPEQKAQEPSSSSSGGGLLDFAKGFFIKKMT
jgi:hypothetical protein